MRILLVDDELAIQRAVGPLLRSRGYEVDVAGTGAEALDLFEQRTPDLIVLDLGLPDIEGTEVCRRIRAKSPVPIIVLSARSAERDKVNALDLGADDYVTKPFGPEELLARIRVALRRMASARSAAPAIRSSACRLRPEDNLADKAPPAPAHTACQVRATATWTAVSTNAVRATFASRGMNCGRTTK